MCLGPELAVVAGVASAAGTAVSAFGQMQAGRAQAAQARYQQQVARNNQIYLERQAERKRQEGEIAAQEARRKARRLSGRQQAVMAGSGVDVGQGTAVDVAGDTAMFGEADALTIRDRYETEAVSLEQQGRNQGAQAELYGAAAKNRKRSSGIAAAGTILSGASTVSDRWYQRARLTEPNTGVGG